MGSGGSECQRAPLFPEAKGELGETRLAEDTRVLGATQLPLQGPGAEEEDVSKQGQRTWGDSGPQELGRLI